MRKNLLLGVAAALSLSVGLGTLFIFGKGGIGHSPYAGEQERVVKALSAKQVAGLLEGKGLGYAKSAELNGWPGPLHVLELDSKLELTPDQTRRMQLLRQEMLARVIPLGKDLIAAEMELDAVFARENPTSDAISDVTRKIALIEGQLRAVHLATHLETAPLLSATQRATYQLARGYGAAGGHTGH